MIHRKSPWISFLLFIAFLAVATTATAQAPAPTTPEPAVAQEVLPDGESCSVDTPEPVETDFVSQCSGIQWETMQICMQTPNCPNACEEAGGPGGGEWCRGHCDYTGCCVCLCQ